MCQILLTFSLISKMKKMNSIKLNKSLIPYLVIAGLVIYILMIGRSEEKEILIQSQENTMSVENPVEESRVDTIYKDSIRRVEVLKIVKVENPVNKELLAKYEKAVSENDSLKQLQLYKEAITERRYNETFEDSVQTISVESNVIGTLKSQVVNYKTKERTVKVQPDKLKPSVFVGGFSYGTFEEPVFGANMNLLNKDKNKLFTIGYDTQKRVHFGVTIKLF